MTKPTKESFTEWLSSLPIGKMNHLGEYYTHLTNKNPHLQSGTASVAFMRWLKEYFYDDELPPYLPFGDWVKEWAEENNITVHFFRDWRGQGFLWQFSVFKGDK